MSFLEISRGNKDGLTGSPPNGPRTVSSQDMACRNACLAMVSTSRLSVRDFTVPTADRFSRSRAISAFLQHFLPIE